jgi:hypothetical protein
MAHNILDYSQNVIPVKGIKVVGLSDIHMQKWHIMKDFKITVNTLVIVYFSY